MRDLEAQVATDFAADSQNLVLFYEGVFESGTLRLCSLPYAVSWDSQTWLGAGELLGFSGIEETTELKATGCALSLACTAEIAQLALAQSRTGQSGKVWLGTRSYTAGVPSITADPYLAFEGRLDVPSIKKGERPVVTIAYESRLRDLEWANEMRMTDQDHRRLFPGDRFFARVPRQQEKVINW